ncbi:MAG: metal-dependent transcriptional regulator [Armatimonadetes bacterium]|nr:metal-dependent transcriptional regulator [Armatimonadota bacterium]
MNVDLAVSANTEEYLEWIYRLSKEQDRVTTTDLARKMKISPASVTGMLKRLAEQGLIHYQPYRGIALTEGGRLVGAKIIRRHALLERLLYDVLGLPWHKVDEAVRDIEHYITEEVEERLAHFLGYPTTCPHGEPMDWELAAASTRLSQLEAGKTAVISRIGDESPEFLQYVESLGLLPGAHLTVTGRAPFNGPLLVRVGDKEYPLGDGVTRNIWVHRASVADTDSEPLDTEPIATPAA